jgi:hypothetical protein
MIMSRAATAAAAAAAHNHDDDESDDDDVEIPPNPPVLFGFDRCLFLCGVVSPLLRASLMNIHSLDSLHTLVSLTNESLDTTATNVNKTRRAANEAPLVVNAIHLQRLKAMRLWATWQVRMAIPLREADFNELHLEWGVDRMEFESRCITQSQGTASISSRQARAFQILKTTTYDGKSNKSSFDNFVGTLQFAFTELDDCDIILSGVQKVDYMLTGFTAPERLAVRNRIINTELESDFAECCSHISQYLAKSSIYDGPGGAKRAISSVGSNKKKIKFTNEEWNALTADEKTAVRALRKKLKKAKATTTPLAATVPKVAATPRTKVAAVTSTKATVDDDATSDEEVPMKPAAKKNK